MDSVKLGIGPLKEHFRGYHVEAVPEHEFRRGWTKYDVFTISHMYELTNHTLPIVEGGKSLAFRPYFADPVPELPLPPSSASEDLLAELVTDRLVEFFATRRWRVKGRRLVFPEDYFAKAGQLAGRLTAGVQPFIHVFVELADLSSFRLGTLEIGSSDVELILVVQEEREPPDWLGRLLRKLSRRLPVQEQVHLAKRSVLGQEFAGLPSPHSHSPALLSWVKTINPLQSL